MPAEFGGGYRDDDLVARPGEDLVVASGAAVRLRRLVGLDVADIDRVGVGSAFQLPRRGHPGRLPTSRSSCD